MSTGFRIFILILCAFGAISVYRFRSPELIHWLRQTPPAHGAAAEPPLVSPLDRILDPDEALARAWLRGKETLPEPAERMTHLDPGPEPLPEEDLANAADLPIVEDEGPPPEADPGDGSSVAGGEDAAPPEHLETEDAPEPGRPGPPEVVAFDEIAYEVKDGDSLWKIASRILGSGPRFQEIRTLNEDIFKDRGSDHVPAGTILKIRVPAGGQGLKPPRPATDTSVERSPAPLPQTGAGDRAAIQHTVKRSENLKGIAHHYYPDDADGWRTIFSANKDRLTSPDLVREGQVLLIPRR